jgi:mono/diheme cytochrome c family protein
MHASLAAVLVLALTSTVTQSSTAQDIESIPKPAAAVHGNAKNGKRLYDSYGCYECHGEQGQGSPLTGPSIGPEPMNFTAFVRYIRRPRGQMPPYTGRITSDAELDDIYAFLQSLPHPPDAKDVPLLTPNSAAGKKK